jgi:hypothetical protein
MEANYKNKACQVIFKYIAPVLSAPGIYVVCFQIFFYHGRMVMENLFILGQIASSSRV